MSQGMLTACARGARGRLRGTTVWLKYEYWDYKRARSCHMKPDLQCSTNPNKGFSARTTFTVLTRSLFSL
eukprot:3346010-Amphidinium_carterae.4